MNLKKIQNKWVKIVGLIILLSGLATGVYMLTGKDKEIAEEIKIQEYTLTKQAISETLSTSGTVQSKSVEQLLGDVSSEVTSIYVGIGDKVLAGEILAEMNPIDVNSEILNQEVAIAKLEQDMKALSEDKGNSKNIAYEAAKTTLNNSKISYENNKILFEDGAVSKINLDQSLESYNKAKSDYENAKSTFNSYDYSAEYSILKKQLEVAKTNLESLKQDLLDHKVVASIDGVVTILNIEEGEVPRESDIMMEIQDLSALKIEASISEYEIRDIKVGQKVSITTLGNDEVTYNGLVETIYPSGEISGSEVFVTVVIDVLDEDENLKPNFSANLDILLESKEAVFLVPYDALIKKPKGGYVVHVKSENGNETEFIPVETGVEGNMNVEIISKKLEEGMVLLVESEVEIIDQKKAGLMIPGMGGGDRKKPDATKDK